MFAGPSSEISSAATGENRSSKNAAARALRATFTTSGSVATIDPRQPLSFSRRCSVTKLARNCCNSAKCPMPCPPAAYCPCACSPWKEKEWLTWMKAGGCMAGFRILRMIQNAKYKGLEMGLWSQSTAVGGGAGSGWQQHQQHQK